MATLEKIRSKGALLVGAVGFALLAFVVGDFLHSGSSFFNKSQEIVGKVGSDDINIKEYTEAIEQMTEVYKIETGRAELNEDMITQLRQSVWENMVTEKLLNEEAKKVGITVSPEELSDRLIGNNIHPLILQRRVFAGENGQFSRSALLQFYNSLQQPAQNDEMKQQQEKAKSYWMFWEKNVKNSILQEKYNTLISKAISANSLDAKMSYQDRKTSVDVAFVVKPYYMISDSAVKVTPEEIKERYNKQKEQYKQEENCAIKFVAFDIKPSKEDYKEAEQWMNKLVDEFKTTTDVAGVVNSNSDIMYDGHAYTASTVPANLKSFAFSGSTGAVYGPVFENDTYTMARIMEAGLMEADSVKLRHIFVAAKDSAKVDSIMGAIKSGGDFAALARKYSAIQQTAANGGEIGWLTRDMQGMDKEIITDAFSKPLKEIFTIKNAQGTQIMQATEKSAARPKVKLAILERKVTPGNRTYSKIYNDAKQFAAELSADKFDSKAKDKGYVVRPANDILKSADRIMDIPQSRQIVRWAFKSTKGDVSDVFECGKEYIVAVSTEINKKGYRAVEKVSDAIKAEIVKDKKAELLIKELGDKLKSNASLEALAASMNDSVKVAKAVNFASYQFGMAGFEPTVIGKSSIAQLNKVSAPIKGNAGVYVIRTSNKVENPQPFNVNVEKMQLNGRMAYGLPYMVLQDIRDKADVVDNRLNFF